MMLDGLGHICLRQAAGLLKDSSRIVLSGRQSKWLLPMIHDPFLAMIILRRLISVRISFQIDRTTKGDVRTSSPIKVTYESWAISALHGEGTAGSQTRMELIQALSAIYYGSHEHTGR